MQLRLEKINHIKRQNRYYILSIDRDLFGEWELTRQWGRIGAKGGQMKVERYGSLKEVNDAYFALKRSKLHRGYGSIPVQLELFSEKGFSQGGTRTTEFHELDMTRPRVCL